MSAAFIYDQRSQTQITLRAKWGLTK